MYVWGSSGHECLVCMTVRGQQAQMRGEICFQLDLPQRVWEWVLSLYHVVSRDGTQAVSLGGKHLYWLSHLPGLLFMTFITV